MYVGGVTTTPSSTDSSLTVIPTTASMFSTMDMGSAFMASTAPSATTSAVRGIHDMNGMSGESSCSVFMLRNQATINACFLTRSWHITSTSIFAGSCIAVILLPISLEFLRRRRYRLHQPQLQQENTEAPSGSQADMSSPSTQNRGQHQHRHGDQHRDQQSYEDVAKGEMTVKANREALSAALRKKLSVREIGAGVVEQGVRATPHVMQFAIAYVLMLLAMSYNGYILVSIFNGVFLGSFIFQWRPGQLGPGSKDSTLGCG